jgi:hypothetical protein
MMPNTPETRSVVRTRRQPSISARPRGLAGAAVAFME